MQLRLIDKIEETHDVTTFIFRPQEPTTWIAGQSIKIEVLGVYGPIEHRFTISSAPFRKNIAITTRRSQSAYKQKLFALAIGEEVRAFAIDGTFVWHESSYPHIFLAAGIGITPFKAMISERAQKSNLPITAELFYHAREADHLFKNTFNDLSQNNKKLKIHYLTHRITASMVQTLPDVMQRDIYISGPSSMVDELSNMFLTAGVNEQLLHRDWFTGNL